MAGKAKPKAYCSIISYLEDNYPDFAEVVNRLCLNGPLSSTKGKNGLTVIIPTAKHIKKITDLAYSDDVDKVHNAADMILAMCFRDSYKMGKEWETKEVHNLIFPSQVVTVTGSTGSEVTFEGGAKAKIDSKFIDSSRKLNLSVWQMQDGEIAVTKDKAAIIKSAKKIKGNRGAKRGAYDETALDQLGVRSNIALVVENMFLFNDYQKKLKQEINNENCLLSHALSLVKFIMERDRELFYGKVLPMLTYSFIDFYILLEPHKIPTSDFLIPDPIIDDWWSDKRTHTKLDIVATVKEINGEISKGTERCLFYTDRQKMFELIDGNRKKLNEVLGSSPREVLNEMYKIYTELQDDNTINKEGPILPESLHEFYRTNKGLKLLHDELRYLTHNIFDRSETNHDLNIMFNMIAEVLHEGEASTKLLKRESLKNMISPNQKIEEIKIFTNSTMFMFVTMTEQETNIPKSTMTRPKDLKPVMFNIAGDNYEKHKRLITNNKIIDEFMAIDLATLDKEILDKIKEKIKQ